MKTALQQYVDFLLHTRGAQEKDWELIDTMSLGEAKVRAEYIRGESNVIPFRGTGIIKADGDGVLNRCKRQFTQIVRRCYFEAPPKSVPDYMEEFQKSQAIRDDLLEDDGGEGSNDSIKRTGGRYQAGRDELGKLVDEVMAEVLQTMDRTQNLSEEAIVELATKALAVASYGQDNVSSTAMAQAGLDPNALEAAVLDKLKVTNPAVASKIRNLVARVAALRNAPKMSVPGSRG